MCIIRGKIFYGGEKLSCSLTTVLGFQLIIKGRAKIFQGVEFFLLNHMSLDVCMCKNFGPLQPKGCRGLGRYPEGLNEPLI